jgi:hypothetical protein
MLAACPDPNKSAGRRDAVSTTFGLAPSGRLPWYLAAGQITRFRWCFSTFPENLSPMSLIHRLR